MKTKVVQEEPGPVQSSNDISLSSLNRCDNTDYYSIDISKSKNVKLFVTCMPSIMQLITRIFNIARSTSKGFPQIVSWHRTQHVISLNISPTDNDMKCWNWKGLPYLASTSMFLVDLQICHGLLTSGVLIFRYDRLCEGATIGITNRSAILKVQTHYFCLRTKSRRLPN